MVEANTRIDLSMARKSAKKVGCTNGVLGRNFGLLMGVLGPLLFTCIINTPVECISLSPVYWNHSNPIFKSSKNDHIVFVNPFDEIDFVCPHYAAPLSTTSETNNHSVNAMEFYLIYQVSKSEYDECFIMSSADSVSHRLLLSCTQPTQRRRFTIWFDPFQSVPRVPEYKPRHSYYFITTSTGHRSGLNNLLNGACALHNMKLTIRIGDIVDADDDVDDERTDDVTRDSDRIKNTERLRHDDDDDDDDDDDNRRHLHHLPHHHQQHRQPHEDHHHHHHHHHTGRPMFRHEKGLSLNSSSSSSFVYSRRNLSRHLSMFVLSSRSSSDPLTSSAKQTTSGAPRDFMKDAVYDVSHKDRWTEAKDRRVEESSSRSEEQRAVRLRQNTPPPEEEESTSPEEEERRRREEAAASDAAAPLLSSRGRVLLVATTTTTSLPFTNCIVALPPTLYATIIVIVRNFRLL